MRRHAVLAAATLLLACGSSESSEPASEPEDDEPAASEAEASEAAEEPPPELPEATASERLMRGHYGAASEARDALIRGDIERARDRMGWLADHAEGDALADSLQPRLEAMQADAAAFSEATTLTEAGEAHARTLVRCGECHSASGGGFDADPPPVPEGEGAAAHMQRHRWAAERMWEGLVTADEERFGDGVGLLTEAPLHGELPDDDEQPRERVEAMAAHVHELGEQAAAAEGWDARADIYGRFLATCAACHRLLDVGPEAPVEPVLEE